jgi:putative transposase
MTDKWLTINDIAELLSCKKESIKKQAQRKKWPYRSFTTRGGHEHRYRLAILPEDIQAAYAAGQGITLDELTARLFPALTPELPDPAVKPWKKIHAVDRETARLREKVILAWRDSGLTQLEFCAAYASGGILPELRDALGESLPDSTLSRWVQRYRRSGIEGLAPRYEHRRGGSGASLDEHTKALIKFYYLHRNKISLRKTHRDLEKKEGIRVNYSTLRRYVNNEISDDTKDFFRKGEKYWCDHHEPYLKRDYTRLHSMQVAVADHKTFDFVSRVWRADGWHIVRLSLTCIIDMRSRKILGWCIDEVPSTLTIIRAVRMMVEQYGCPEAFLVDNGKDFSSYWFAGDSWNERHHTFGKKDKREISSVAGDMDTIVQFCTPYRGQSKPIERFFGFVSGEHDKAYDSYTGSNTSDRIDERKLYWGNFNGKQKIPIEELPTKEEVREIFAGFARWFNSEWHHGGQGMDHKTPDIVFEENRRAKRTIPEEYQKYAWTRREIRTVQRGAVSIDNQLYYNREMQLIDGQDVEVRISIDDIGAAYIFNLKTGTYICDADTDLKDSGITEENLRNLNRLRKAQRKHIDEAEKDLNEIKKNKLTRLEELREEKGRQVTLKVVGGDPVTPGAAAPLALVETPEPARRKYRTIFDVDD